MQAVAERYMRRDKNDRVEDLGKAVYTLERLKEKEIEHDDKYKEIPTKDGYVRTKSEEEMMHERYIDTLKYLLERYYKYLARDMNGELWAYDIAPVKLMSEWSYESWYGMVELRSDIFPEVKWTDDEPTKIADLLATYENGGENGK